MKKGISGLLFAMLLAALLSAACASTGSGADSLGLREAIKQSAEKTAAELPRGSQVAVVAFESANNGLSEFIMEELSFGLKDRGVGIVERQELEHVLQELDFQMSGYVSDESARSIGKFLGAGIVITGQLSSFGGVYRFRTNAIDVETAARVSITRFDVRSDRELQRMIGAMNK